jgi:hypothetical protein
MDDKVLARLDTMEQNLRLELRDVATRMYNCQRECREDLDLVDNKVIAQEVQLGGHLSAHKVWFRIIVGLLTSTAITLLGFLLTRLLGG